MQCFVYRGLSIVNKLCMVHNSAIIIDSSISYYKDKILNPLVYGMCLFYGEGLYAHNPFGQSSQRLFDSFAPFVFFSFLPIYSC